jgi:hypothetical protein
MIFPFEHLFTKKYQLKAHILFWALVLLFYTIFYGHQRGEYYKTFVYVCLLFPVTMGTTYLMMYVLIPRYLLKAKYGYFFLFFAYSLLFSIWLESLIFSIAFITIAEYKVVNLNPSTFDVFFLIVSMYLVVFLASAIKLLRQWYEIRQAHQQLQTVHLEAALKLKEAELHLLKAQFHPHFLFNTLNNLYGLTLEKSDQAPSVVLKIADLLDYLLYKCNVPKVALEQEIMHIENYIALEKLRYHKLNLNFVVKGNTKNKFIAPMLILPFIENGFKHGLSKALACGKLTMELSVEDKWMTLQVENSKTTETFAQGYSEGIGLQNVKKRLSLLYKDKHSLQILEKESAYIVNLQLLLEEG